MKTKQGLLSPSATKKSFLNLTDQGELKRLRKEVEQLWRERNILQGAFLGKKGRSLLCERTPIKYGFI